MCEIMNKAIFLDRDGVINQNDPEFAKNVSYYVSSPSHFIFLPSIFVPLKLMQEKGYLLFIISDQPGVGKGLFTSEILEEITSKMLATFESYGINITKTYYCIHTKEDNCICRKPQPTNILNAQKEFNLDLNQSYFIGDKTTDIETGKRAGCKTILVLTGYKGEDRRYIITPDYIVENLSVANRVIL